MHPSVPIKRVLIPIDFSDGARRAFYAGVGLAAKYGAETWIMHVNEPVSAWDVGKKKYIEAKDVIERVEEGVKRRVDELWSEGGIEAVDRRKIHVLVRSGKAHKEILDTARAKNIDLIVMGHSDATGVEAVIGGTAERVLRNAPCSVLCIRASE